MLCAEETSGGDLDGSIDPAVSSLCRWISPQTCLLCDKKRATSLSGISSGQNSDEKDKGTTILLNTVRSIKMYNFFLAFSTKRGTKSNGSSLDQELQPPSLNQ